MHIKLLVNAGMVLGESPLWDVDQDRLYWIDIIGQNIFRCTADGRELSQWEMPFKIGSMALRKDNSALVAFPTGFYFYDFKRKECSNRVCNIIEETIDVRLNDGKVDRQGRFICGSMDLSEKSPIGMLYRFDPDLSIHVLERGIIVTNGPCWSPDGSSFYFSDSGAGITWLYDYSITTGNISNRRIFSQIDTSISGYPDGATVDAEGFLWKSLVFSGKIIRYAPDGTIDRIIEMPVKNVTSLMFGGSAMDVLFVTSMAEPPLSKLMKDGSKACGSVFAIYDLGVCGIPEKRFDG